MIAVRGECLKWVGLGAMLVDHSARFLHVALPGWLWIGRLAFPCFAIALGLQVVPDRRLCVAFRLVCCAALVFPLQWYASGVLVFSVLGTLGLGLCLAWCFSPGRDMSRSAAGYMSRLVVGLLLFGASLSVEFGFPGVMVVAGASLLSDRVAPWDLGAVLLALGVVKLGLIGGAPVFFAFVLVGAYCASGGVEVARLKGVFMNAYFAQWAVFAAARFGLFT
jgi:hypothetical protein